MHEWVGGGEVGHSSNAVYVGMCGCVYDYVKKNYFQPKDNV